MEYGPGTSADPDIPESVQLACHELLLRLAGRLHDSVLWRYRDWLAAGALDILAKTLPKTLLRNDIDLNTRDHELLSTALLPYGADPHQVSSTLGVDEASNRRYTFSEAAPERLNTVDAVVAVVDAALRGRPEVGEVRESWRYPGTTERGEAKRVLLVTAVAGWARLAGELQRVLRVLGDEVPSIEVLPQRIEVPDYHLTALANSRRVSAGAVASARPGATA